MKIRRTALTLSMTVAAFVVPAAAGIGAQALAACSTTQEYFYVKNGHLVDRGTNIRSDWLTGPGRITYTKTATAESNTTYNNDMNITAEAVIANISTTYGKSVGKSKSTSQSWSYGADVPAGKTRYLQQFYEHWRVTVVKWKYTNKNCKTTKVIKEKVATFPLKNGHYLWELVGGK
ncbi:hypothetical protein NLX83_11830 [Allokutzneria sp. A3M-2-11 16]|uniref:hypothetical protein n=1 Tax=Allokutzneria sp. A3M-2-11 16 TaxID=2962043 RepID=UPI0020B6DC65|nr:hypothetical protein [Allokutzneria sp. A3M-2-11 16]MCP3799945.1 hypothetical protein [Allokutzneria sp. A3M-2-11 16]